MKKKVLLIHHSGLLGGAGISLYNTWKSLSEDYEVECFVPTDPPDLLNFLKSKGLKPKTFAFRLGKITYYSGGNKAYNLKFWYHALHSLTQIRYWSKVLEKEKPDLVLVNSKVLCWMGMIFKKHNLKSICFVRETIPGNPKRIMNFIMKKMLEQFTSVIFLTNYDLKQTNLKSHVRTAISPDFLRVTDYEKKVSRKEACEKLKLKPDSFTILFLGGMDKLKGIEVALKSLILLKNQDVQLVVAGKRNIENELKGIKKIIFHLKSKQTITFSRNIKKIIEENDISHKVHFIGIQRNLSDCFTASDVLIFPMILPHQPRPAFEIGVQKKPVIISDFPNIKEIVQNEVNGLTFQPNDEQSLANSILRLKENKELRNLLGDMNYQFTIKYHSEDFAMEQLRNEITYILGGN